MLQYPRLMKLRCFPTLILFLYKGSGGEGAFNPKDRDPLWHCSLGCLAVPLETNCTTSLGCSPSPVHPVRNELQLVEAASELSFRERKSHSQAHQAGTGTGPSAGDV